MSYVYSASIYSPGEGKTVRNLEDSACGWRGEISSSRAQVDFEHPNGPPVPRRIRTDEYSDTNFSNNNNNKEPVEMSRRHFEMAYRVPGVGGSGAPASAAPSPRHDDEDYSNETLFFERNRIKQLQDERVHIQKKTFTKWCNSFLNRARLEINDLFVDVGDGVLLMKLLEIISGDKLGKPNRGRMRVQKIENLNKVLDFLKKKKIQLENIGAEDILDRNERLILGLIWTIILRFQIDTIVIEDENDRGERRQAKDALLLWCQRKTAGYAHVRVENFTTSWRNGLAFNALIHAHRPELISYNALNPQDHIGNLNNAFDVAEKKLEIARLLDAEDVDTARPDEKSVITYVSLYYHYFAKQKTEMTGARRVANIIGKLIDSETMEDDYEHISSELLKWIKETIVVLDNRRFINSLPGLREELKHFNDFRSVEKPLKYKEKGELEALIFTIQTKRKAMSRKPYVPPNGLAMNDIESAWERLDRSENNRQIAIIAELQRQEKLEQWAQRFNKKAALREAWLRNVLTVLEEMDHQGTRSAADVEKSLKKQQAIAADILAREDRFKMLTQLCNDIGKEKYHEADKIRARERSIMERWAQLLSLLEARRRSLASLNDLTSLLRDIDTLSCELNLLEPLVRNRDIGKHLLGVEDLLGKHELIEAQVKAQGAWLDNISSQAHAYIRSKGEQYDVLQRKLEDVNAQYSNLVSLCRNRRLALEKARELFQFVQDHEEEVSWVKERDELCRRALEKGDLSSVHQTNLMFKNVETEMNLHWDRAKKMIAVGEHLVQSGQNKDDIQRRINELNVSWTKLRQVVQALGKWLEEARKAQQYFQDANEAESWIREKMPLVRSDDLGRDELAAERLLQRHARLEEEIHSYRSDIVRLEELAQQLSSSSFHSAQSSSQETEEVSVPQVEMAYKYEGNGMSVGKHEILALLDQSTAEWWRVLKQDGTEGYVPSNYCRIVPGETVTVTQSTSKKGDTGDSRRAIVDRQNVISNDYRQLNDLADVRRRLLSDNIKLMSFYRECDEFESWANETRKALVDEPTVELVAAYRKKFDKIESDMKANGMTQLQRINGTAGDLVSEGHSQSRQIEARQKKMNVLWEDLERLRAARGARLAATERIADFDAQCADAVDWMQGKFAALDKNDQDLKSLQNLERDLKPLEDKIAYLKKLADEMRKTNPEAAAAIDKKVAELEAMHADLLRRAREKVKLAEQSQGREMFESALGDALVWIDRTKKQLAEDVRPMGVIEAEELLKKHYELGEQLKDKKYEVEYVNDLGRRLLQKNPRLSDVEEKLKHLHAEMAELKDLYRLRDARLKEQLDLQLFNQEAERIDAATKGHEAFLDYADVGDCVEAVEGLLKRHRDLEAKLEAQESRLQAFSHNADDLIKKKHSESPYIDGRRNEVLARRAAVRRAAQDRRHKLEASLEYQNLCRDGEELMGWIHDKKKLATDDAHRDLATIASKLLKHEAFEAEVHANAPRVEQINKEGAVLINRNHYESPSVERLVRKVNAEWAELADAVDAKGDRLRQAADQKGLNLVLDDANAKLDELEAALRSQDVGADLRAAKELLQRQTVVENEMAIHKKRLLDIESRGKKMADQGHFDADRINYTIAALLKRFDELSGPAAARRIALEESRKWHQLAFDVDCEMQWIAEKRPIAALEDTGRTLTEALNMLKKLEQLEAEVQQHSGQIERTLEQGEALIRSGHRAEPQINEKCQQMVSTKVRQLSEAWSDLQRLVMRRRNVLDWGVKEQQYLFDAAEIEGWMTEKRAALVSEDYGTDEDAAQKLLAKHKALQNDMQTYLQWLDKLGAKCQELVDSRRPNVDRFTVRQKELEAEFQRLSKLAEERRRALEDAVLLYEYMRESADLEQWINAQLHVAISEDYGEDYEHLKELKSRFEDFKQQVKTGSERFVSCEAAANALLRRNPPFARDVLKKQEQLRAAWRMLLDYIESREQKLAAAEELHRFNRDVSEHEEWVANKMGHMPLDLGRDVKHVHKLWQEHETVEAEISGAEPRLQNLLEESARLKLAYPGGNADHIGTQQTALADGWQDLKDTAADRKDTLRAAYDLHRFQGEVRDLLAWTDLTVQDMQSEVVVHDLQQAEWLEKEHERLASEIDAREPEFARLVQTGEKMIAAEHYATADIKLRVEQVSESLVKLRSEWKLRQSYLQQVVQWHAFQREAKQILATISSKSTTLKSLAVGGSVADVEGQTKRLETFSKALSTLDDRTSALDATATGLIEARHMEKDNIELWRRKVHKGVSSLRAEVEGRRQALGQEFALAAFHSDAADMDQWVEDKLKGIYVETQRQEELGSIEDKMKRLQKHQALEAEIASNKKRLDQVLHNGNELFALRRDPQITSTCDQLRSRWAQLTDVCSERSRALEEFRDLLAFRLLVDRILHWCRDKEMMVAAQDMGRDLEHCKMLINKLDGSSVDSSVDEQTLQEINRLGEKIVRQGRSSREEVQQQQQHLNNTWQSLQGKLAGYRNDLASALEVHGFNRDVDDTDERIHEKIAAMKSDDFGKDFTSVDALMRKQNALERDMTAIHQKLVTHDQEAQKILAKKPPLKQSILDSLKKLEESWHVLSVAADTRNRKLDKSYQLYKYIDNVKKSEQWANQVRSKMTSYQQPKTSIIARQLIQQHAERKAEIDGRQEELRVLHEEGQRLVQEQPEHKSEVQRAHKRVQNSEHQLRQTWEAEKAVLQRTLDWLLWGDQATMCEQWLTDKENHLKQTDLGDNPDAVQMLIKSHDAFDELVKKQSEKITVLSADADKLLASDNEFKGDIEARRNEIAARHDALLESSRVRRRMLADSKRYHEFICSCGELTQWITAKLQLAYDESYLDAPNLRAKLQTQLAFDSELAENEKRLAAVESQGDTLIADRHFLSDQIRLQQRELRSGWDELRTKSSLKTERLRMAYEESSLMRKIEDFEKWLNKIEAELSTDDHGRDLISVGSLVKKLDTLAAEIEGRQPAVEDVLSKARELNGRGSMASGTILEEAEKVEHRYKSLKEPVHIRRENLDAARRLFEWLAAAEEELEWLADKQALARSVDVGDSLLAAQSLHKKHANLEKEMESRSASIMETESKGYQMVREGHFAANHVRSTIDQLSSAVLSFKDALASRRERLQAAVEANQFFTEVSEAEQWIRDQMPLAANQEVGRDEASVESHLRRLTVLDKEVAQFRNEIDRLKNTCDALLEKPHHDANQVAGRQRKLETSYGDLVRECNRRRKQLVDAGKYHRFVRQVDDLGDWLRDKERAASSEDYGRDLEDCQQLVEQFETVVRELAAAGERVATVHRTQEELLRSGHPNQASIKAKGEDLQRLWTQVNQAAIERQQALAGAKQVHRFDQEADQTITWLEQKEASGVAMEQEDLSQADLAVVKTQMQKHDEFMHSIKAVEKQVIELCREAERLWSVFPNTREHLEVRKMSMTELLRDIMENSGRHYERLRHMESLQAYFQEYRELIQWLKRMQATIISEQLPRDVKQCEALARRHEEYNLEMQSRKGSVDEFIRQGRQMVQAQHVLQLEIHDKVDALEQGWAVLCEVWRDRHELYTANADCQGWKENATELEQWLLEREQLLGEDWRSVDTVEGVETSLRDFDDFLVTLDAQQERCNLVKRITLIEQNWSKLRHKESERGRIADEEQRRRDTIKVVEKGNILANRRQERERRKTQEISLLRPSPSTDEFTSSQTLPRKMDKRERSKTTGIDVGNAVAGANLGHGTSGGNLSESTTEMHKTPSFNTRRTHSTRVSRIEEMGAIDMRGFVDRKQDMQTGGKKATIRSWKQYYTILCGQLMCFFKDENAFHENQAFAPPVYIYGARAEPYPEYVKRRHAFRLVAQDGSSFIFSCPDERQMLEWVAKVKFHAGLAPSNQLKSYSYNVGASSTDAPVPAPRSRDGTLPSRSSSTSDDASLDHTRDYYSLPRGATSVQVDFRDVATLPRGATRGGSLAPMGLSSTGSYGSLGSSSGHLPTLVEAVPRKIARRESRRQSVYAECVYGDMLTEQQTEQEQTEEDGDSMSAMRQYNTNGNLTETLKYEEHQTSSYRPSSQSAVSRSEQAEFISWVESQQMNSGTSSPLNSSHNDTDSIKSESQSVSDLNKSHIQTSIRPEKKGFSLFKRGSKYSSKS